MEVDYQRALELALPKRGLQFQREVEIPIAYDGVVVTKRGGDFVIRVYPKTSWPGSHARQFGGPSAALRTGVGAASARVFR